MNSFQHFIRLIVETAFSKKLILFGGGVRSLLLNETPNDLDFWYTDADHKNNFMNNLILKNMELKQNEKKYDNRCYTYTITDKQSKYSIEVDLVYIKDIMTDVKIVDFNVNSLYMKSFSEICTVLKYNLLEVLTNIHNKKFCILQTFDKNLNITQPDKIYLIRLVKMQARTAKLLSNGWVCWEAHESSQWETVLKKHFHPLMITKDKNSYELSNLQKCCFCNEILQNEYILKLQCCRKFFCSNCLLNYIKENFLSHEIICPLCFSDPFGFKKITITI